MSFRSYPTYKASGVDWLGHVPEHWRVDRFKRSVGTCRNGIWGEEPQGDANDIPCVRVADFDRERLVVVSSSTLRNVTELEREGRLLSHNDLLLEKSGGGDTQPVGCVVLYQDMRPAVCSNFIARVQLRGDMNPSFWRYVHAAAYAVRLNTRSIKQTSGLQNLDQQQYFDERVAFPPLPEQTAIADFLDRETAKIYALVAKQRRLIELLKEKRQAVISHAVTKGLNPDAPMKPSGIDWLGDVPAHWGVGGLTKYLASVVDYRGRTPEKVDEGVFLVTAKNVRNGRIDYEASQEFIASAGYDDVMRRGRPEIGDVLFTTEAPLGQVANVDQVEVALAQRIIKFRGQRNVLDNYFLKYWLMGAFSQADMERLATGSTALGIKGSKVVQLRLCLPPYGEQQKIVNVLDEELMKLDELVGQAEGVITLLQERRTALVASAVTGQIDVRGLTVSEAV